MDRRSFLKRSTAGAVAAYAALRWRAPERPPELEDVAEVGASQEPTWWAECEINGVKHRVEQLTGPVAIPEPIESWDQENGLLFAELIKTRDLDMVLWAEDSRFLHVLDLVKTGKKVDVKMRFPERGAAGRVHFEGYVVGIQEPHDRAYVPTFEATVRMTGMPEWLD